MKIVQFLSYDPKAKDADGKAAVHARAWTLAVIAMGNAPSGQNAAQTSRAVKTYNKVRGLSVKDGDERRLNPDGATLRLEDEEMGVLQAAIDKMREQIPAGQADSLVYLDELLASAPSEEKPIH